MIKFLLGFVFITAFAQAEMGVPIKIKLKSPAGVYPTESGLNVKVLVLSPETSCILREENFSSQTINNGSLVVNLGSGARGTNDPNLSLNQIYDNSKPKSGLSCVDVNSAVVQTGQIYTPVSDSFRIARIITVVGGENITLNFNMKSTPYAIQAESVGGKLGSDIVVNDITTQLNQTNLTDLLFDITRFNNLKNLAISGQASSAATATQAVSFTGSLNGDVSGTQSVTSVNKIKGIPVSATAPVLGQVLIYNGTEYAPSTPVAAPVSSVAGRTGSVVLSSSDISGLGNSAGLNVGSAAGTVAAGDDSRIVNSATEIANATSVNTASSIVKRDGTGSAELQNLNLAGDINLSGAMNGLSKNAVYQNAPTTAGTVTAYTLSYGAAMDAKILTNTVGDTVRFKVNAVNTGAATLKVAGAAAASLFSAFTGASVAAGDLQIGYYEATFDGTNWLVTIPPRIYKNTGLNWAVTTALTITASGVNAGDYATCSLSTGTATATTTTKYWNTSVLVRAGFIQVVGIRVSTPPNVTAVTCLVQK